MKKLWNENLEQIHTLLNGSMRLVGGCVRDTLLGLTPTDIDIATPFFPDRVRKKLKRAGIVVIPTGIAFGTVTAEFPDASYEITSLRRDIETNGRFPRIAYSSSYQEDAARRDFTINALYQDRDGTLYDYHDGLKDLADHRVRFIGEASERIKEDYLRILRYFRFWSRIETGLPDDHIIDAIRANKEGIGRLSIDRRRQELFKLLETPRAMTALYIMDSLDLLHLIAPNFILKDFKGETALERFASMTVDRDLGFYKFSKEMKQKIKDEWAKIKGEAPVA